MKSSHSLDYPAGQLLQKIRRRYLDSRDFNGLHVRGDDVAVFREPAIELVQTGLVQVVSGEDYLNIHIRPWPSRRTVEDQIEDLLRLDAGDYGVCLYPTPLAMKGVRLPKRLSNRPFAKAMAKGKGTLELAYFRFDVLEQYRNDSRYRFSFGDSGAYMGVEDEVYENAEEPEHDKVSLSHIGFAYDLSRYDPEDLDSPIIRRVAVFHADLVSLSAEHQRRWETYQVDGAGLEPHPLWWNSQMGHWPDGAGPFERLFLELRNVNELCTFAFENTMFSTTRRPDELGWLLRPSQREWDEFVLEMDKVLSENLRSQFFDQMQVPNLDDQRQRIGTLNRLQRFMQAHGMPETKARELLKPLRDIRKARQKPAHSIRLNVTDQTFIRRQVAMLQEVNESLMGLRTWLATHPACTEWKQPHKELLHYLI